MRSKKNCLSVDAVDAYVSFFEHLHARGLLKKSRIPSVAISRKGDGATSHTVADTNMVAVNGPHKTTDTSASADSGNDVIGTHTCSSCTSHATYNTNVATVNGPRTTADTSTITADSNLTRTRRETWHEYVHRVVRPELAKLPGGGEPHAAAIAYFAVLMPPGFSPKSDPAHRSLLEGLLRLLMKYRQARARSEDVVLAYALGWRRMAIGTAAPDPFDSTWPTAWEDGVALAVPVLLNIYYDKEYRGIWSLLNDEKFSKTSKGPDDVREDTVPGWAISLAGDIVHQYQQEPSRLAQKGRRQHKAHVRNRVGSFDPCRGKLSTHLRNSALGGPGLKSGQIEQGLLSERIQENGGKALDIAKDAPDSTNHEQTQYFSERLIVKADAFKEANFRRLIHRYPWNQETCPCCGSTRPKEWRCKKCKPRAHKWEEEKCNRCGKARPQTWDCQRHYIPDGSATECVRCRAHGRPAHLSQRRTPLYVRRQGPTPHQNESAAPPIPLEQREIWKEIDVLKCVDRYKTEGKSNDEIAAVRNLSPQGFAEVDAKAEAMKMLRAVISCRVRGMSDAKIAARHKLSPVEFGTKMAEVKEVLGHLWATLTIDALPDKLAEVVACRLEGMSDEEIAKTHNLNGRQLAKANATLKRLRLSMASN